MLEEEKQKQYEFFEELNNLSSDIRKLWTIILSKGYAYEGNKNLSAAVEWLSQHYK